jgi:predicted DsbA family dithiol-disulfide isomerase
MLANLKGWWDSHPAVSKALTDAWTPALSGIIAVLASFQVPNDGDWKAAAFVTAGLCANVIINAVRRSLAANADALAAEATEDIYSTVVQIHDLEALLDAATSVGIDTQAIKAQIAKAIADYLAAQAKP